MWPRDGIIAVGKAHNDKLKLAFSHGARLPDPDGLFDNGFGGKVWRAIDVFEDDTINEAALKTLVRAAVEHNQAKPKQMARAGESKVRGRRTPDPTTARSADR